MTRTAIAAELKSHRDAVQTIIDEVSAVFANVEQTIGRLGLTDEAKAIKAVRANLNATSF